MNLPSKIISIAVIALVIGLNAACWPFSDSNGSSPESGKRTSAADQAQGATADNQPLLILASDDVSITNEELERRREEMAKSKANQNGPSQQTASESMSGQQGARMPNDEDVRRCRFWALDNLDPLRYAAFEKLNPSTMDDLDRILWRQVIGSSGTGYYSSKAGEPADATLRFESPYMKHCMAYWTEPLDAANAALRNAQFEHECRTQLHNGIVNGYERLASSITYEDGGTQQLSEQIRQRNEQTYRTPNQYVRILQWINMTGPELAASQKPPYEILREQSRKPSAYLDGWILTDEFAREYAREHGESPNPEWAGIVRAAALDGSGGGSIKACLQYYPQVFYGYWIPHDEPRDGNQSQEEPQYPWYDLSQSPLYLPKSAQKGKIPAGYPLGMTSNIYFLCVKQNRDDDVHEYFRYHYVEHPTGNYCEPKP